MFVIRRYTEKDIPEMIRCVQLFLEEQRTQDQRNHFFGIDLDEEKVYKWLKLHVNDVCFFTNIVIDENEEIIGGLCGQVVEYIFSRDLVAIDHLLWFNKEKSNLRALLALIKSYVDWAERRGVREVQLRTSTGYKQQGFYNLVTRQGFEQFGVGFSRRFR